MSNSVLQEWVEKIPWKQQSILFSSLRGPDQDYLSNIKSVSRWMRAVSQNNADPSKPYMAAALGDLPSPNHFDETVDKELEHCTVHFVHHFADGLAVIAHHHPDQPTAEYAARLHFHIAEELFHFVPETRSRFLLRHRDKKDGQDSAQKAALWEAMQLQSKVIFMDSVLSRFKEKPESAENTGWKQRMPGGDVITFPLKSEQKI